MAIILYIYVGKTVDHYHPPSSAEPMYEEVGVAGEVKRSHNIQLIFNEAYSLFVKDRIETSSNTA